MLAYDLSEIVLFALDLLVPSALRLLIFLYSDITLSFRCAC